MFSQRTCINCENQLLDELESFGTSNTDDEKLVKNLKIFDFESICAQEDNFRDTHSTAGIGKQLPLTVSISSNLIEEAIFQCNSNRKDSVESFVDALDGLATHNKIQLKLKFLQIVTSVKRKLNQVFSTLNQLRCRKQPVLEFEDECIEKAGRCVDTAFTDIKEPFYGFARLLRKILKRSTSL